MYIPYNIYIYIYLLIDVIQNQQIFRNTSIFIGYVPCMSTMRNVNQFL